MKLLFMDYTLDAETEKNIIDFYHAKYARYNKATSRVEASLDNENWFIVIWPTLPGLRPLHPDPDDFAGLNLHEIQNQLRRIANALEKLTTIPVQFK